MKLTEITEEELNEIAEEHILYFKEQKKSIFDKLKKIQHNINKHNELKRKIKTSPDFWDCECLTNYIHSNNDLLCPICNAFKHDQPNSRIDELIDFGIIYE